VQRPSAGSDSPRPSLLGPALATYSTNVAVAALSLGNVLVTAWALGAVGRGDVALLTTIAYLTSQVAALGVQQASVNFAGRDPALTPTLFGTAIALAAALGCAAVVAVVLLVALVPAVAGSASDALLALSLGAVPMLVLQLFLQHLVLAHHGFRAVNGAWLLVPVMTCAVNGSLALAGALSVGAAVGSWVAGQAIATLLLWRSLARRFGAPARPDRALARRMLGFGVRAHGGRVMLLGNYRLDQWILGGVAGPRELGVYSVAVAWAETLFFLPTALAMVQRPDLVRMGPREAALRAAALLRLALLATIPLAAGLVVLAPVLCGGLFGDEFKDSAGQVRVLAIGAFGIVALKLLGSALTAQGRPLRETAAIGVAFATIVVLDVVLIPPHGADGAALASAIAYSAGGIAVAVLFIRALPARASALLPRPSELPAVLRVLRSRAAERSHAAAPADPALGPLPEAPTAARRSRWRGRSMR
jgi:O-antigen/teichoic acid export membrane protein